MYDSILYAPGELCKEEYKISEQQKKNQWHPGFAAAMRMELAENLDDLIFEEEYNLSSKPLQIDLLIIRNNRYVPIKKDIGRLFKKYNILEFKSPDDAMGVDTFYKVMAYASLYKAGCQKEDGYKADEITITLLRQRYPKKLISYLRNEGYEVTKQSPGVYYVTGKVMFDVQIIVSKELDENENIWLHSLRNNISKQEYQKLLLSVDSLGSKERELYGDAVLDVVSKANIKSIKRWKGEKKVIPTLEKIMAPELEAREMKGLKKGMQKGVKKGRILAYAELGMSLEEISDRVSLPIEKIREILADN